jgi:allantoin racemase
MAELCREIEDALGAPVIEGVTAAVKWVEALVSLRLGTAKRGDYARPLAKRYDGALAEFSPTEVLPQPGPVRGTGAASAAGVAGVDGPARADDASDPLQPRVNASVAES